jgi:hypothetical protein
MLVFRDNVFVCACLAGIREFERQCCSVRLKVISALNRNPGAVVKQSPRGTSTTRAQPELIQARRLHLLKWC